MGILRNIGENLVKEVGVVNTKSRIVFKKNGKYYERLNAEPITRDEVGGRYVISFER
tara:strand:- start:2884 stop:3054 length:171 start_codon:yes stop_codon:yes gene_type:complete